MDIMETSLIAAKRVAAESRSIGAILIAQGKLSAEGVNQIQHFAAENPFGSAKLQ